MVVLNIGLKKLPLNNKFNKKIKKVNIKKNIKLLANKAYIKKKLGTNAQLLLMQGQKKGFWVILTSQEII